jgi:hypothetical protein
MFYVKKADYDSSNIVTKLDEFVSEQNEVTSVVREAIQNVIDAMPADSKEPARARFSFKTIAWKDFSNFIDTDDGYSMNEHWSSPSLKDHSKDGLLQCSFIEYPSSVSIKLLKSFHAIVLKLNLARAGSLLSAGIASITF